MSRQLTIQVMAPNGILWEGEADYARIPGVAGDFGVLPRHLPAVSLLREGDIAITTVGGNRLAIPSQSGFAFVHEDFVTLILNNTGVPTLDC